MYAMWFNPGNNLDDTISSKRAAYVPCLFGVFVVLVVFKKNIVIYLNVTHIDENGQCLSNDRTICSSSYYEYNTKMCAHIKTILYIIFLSIYLNYADNLPPQKKENRTKVYEWGFFCFTICCKFVLLLSIDHKGISFYQWFFCVGIAFAIHFDRLRSLKWNLSADIC